LLVSLFPKLP